MLETERQSSTSDPTMEKELVRLRHSHDKLREVARDLSFDAVGLLRSHAQDDSILLTGFKRQYQAMFDLLIFLHVYFISTHELCS